MATAAGLQAGLPVGAEVEVLRPQGCAVPHARREVPHRAGLVGAVGSTRTHPVRVPPWLHGIRIAHPPHRAATDRGVQRGAAPSCDVGQGRSAQRWLGFCNQCPGDRLDQGVGQRGKHPPCGPVPACRPGPRRPWPNGVATGALHADGMVPAVPPDGWTPAVGEPRAGPGWPVDAPGTEPSCARPSLPPAPRRAAGTQTGCSERDHAWEASSGNTHHHGHHHAASLRRTSRPKT